MGEEEKQNLKIVEIVVNDLQEQLTKCERRCDRILEHHNMLKRQVESLEKRFDEETERLKIQNEYLKEQVERI